jgi:hypothetical protein
MSEEHILMKMTAEKNKRLKEFVIRFIGHEPSKEERKEFTFIHTLGESKIYYKRKLVEVLKYDTTDSFE